MKTNCYFYCRMDITNFNIRVYGIVINAKNELLISKEHYQNRELIKFIGGGLEKGEGLKAALIREFQEELEQNIEVKNLFYINDFFQQSAFVPGDQIISVFYEVVPKDFKNFVLRTTKQSETQSLLWVPLHQLTPDNFTFKIEGIVLKRLQEKY